MSQEEAFRPVQDQPVLKHGMLCLSSICKGEIFGSYIQRQPHHRPLQANMQLCDSPAYSWALPSNIEKYSRLLGEYVGSLEAVLTCNTLLPGFRRFLSPDDAKQVRDHHVGTTVAGIASTVGFSHHRQGLLSTPGICVECIKEDVSANGEAFWRRDFVLSDVRWCARHQIPVRSLCDSCLYSFQYTRKFIAPQSVCFCGRPLVLRSRDDGAQELELEMARGWSQLLDSKFEPSLSGSEVARLTHIKAKELGMVDRNGVRWKMFEEFFDEPRLNSLGRSLGFSFRNPPARDVIRGKRSMRNPSHGLFLLIALYGSWYAVETEILWPCGNQSYALDRSRNPSAAEKARLSTYHIKRYERSITLIPDTVSIYEKLRNDNPELGHIAIQRRLPPSHRLAATRARLEEHGVLLPPAEGGQRDPILRDERAAAHVERRWDQLTRENKPARISRAALIWGNSLRSVIHLPTVAAVSPRTIAALKKYAESSNAFHRRIIRAEVLAGNVPRHPASEVDSIDSMTDEEIMALVRHWRKKRPKKT